jgi:type 2A phosphatase activator TIP41
MEAKAVPRHHVEESDTVRSVTLPAWEISTENHPISNATHLDELHAELGIPLPEMTFGHNLIRLKHKPSRWEYQFDTLHALKCVKNGEMGEGDGAVTVRQSEAWLKSR